jgi:hypothetical protein
VFTNGSTGVNHYASDRRSIVVERRPRYTLGYRVRSNKTVGQDAETIRDLAREAKRARLLVGMCTRCTPPVKSNRRKCQRPLMFFYFLTPRVSSE